MYCVADGETRTVLFRASTPDEVSERTGLTKKQVVWVANLHNHDNDAKPRYGLYITGHAEKVVRPNRVKAKILEIRRSDYDLTEEEIAAAAGVTVRTVRKYIQMEDDGDRDMILFPSVKAQMQFQSEWDDTCDMIKRLAARRLQRGRRMVIC